VISQEELQLAARNHGMPLEALRWDVTPVGLHYLLTHYDIPAVDPASWRLKIGGRVERSLSLSLAELRERPAVTRPVTMECAGNGRARLEPHVVSQPWLLEAVGNAEWTGVLLNTGQLGYVPTADVVELPYEITRKAAPRETMQLSSRSGAAAVASYSQNFIGTPYKWGGNDENNGIDCSGFVKKMYGSIGKELPRTAAEQANVGQPA